MKNKMIHIEGYDFQKSLVVGPGPIEEIPEEDQAYDRGARYSFTLFISGCEPFTFCFLNIEDASETRDGIMHALLDIPAQEDNLSLN